MDGSKEQSMRKLMQIPGVGRESAKDLWALGVKEVNDLHPEPKCSNGGSGKISNNNLGFF